MKRIKSKALKIIAVFLAFNILLESIIPNLAFALTEGPKSPDFSSFTPVATTDMVDLGTGDFNYNIPVIEIPGTEGGGYALSLAYNSGADCEKEASWVGLGWNLNPGIIDRNMRGFPDDYNGETVDYYNKNIPNWTVSSTVRAGMEVFSQDKIKASMGISASQTRRFNNYNGFFKSTTMGMGLRVQGIGLNFNQTSDVNGSTSGVTFSLQISPEKLLGKKIMEKLYKGLVNRMLSNVAKGDMKKVNQNIRAINNLGSSRTVSTGLFTYSDVCKNATFSKLQGFSVNFSAGLGINPSPVPIGFQTGVTANFNAQRNLPFQSANAYGYFNNPQGNTAAMDYYVEKSSECDPRDIFIGMPFSNADVFSVTGEGLSGGFRGYKEKIGSYFPTTYGEGKYSLKSYNVGLEFSVGMNNGMGLDIGFGNHKTELTGWGDSYNMGDSTYFRFNNDLGGKITYGGNNSDLVTAEISSSKFSVPGFKNVSLNESKVFSGRTVDYSEKGSSSNIGYHTYGDINKTAANSFTKKLSNSAKFFDKLGLNPNAIAEYSIVTQNGDNYIYGLPILTRNETNLSVGKFNSTNVVNNYLVYRGTLPLYANGSEFNFRIKDEPIVMGEIRKKPYATSYLLTQITKPNYIDITGDGPSVDDFGGWTILDYRLKYGAFDTWYRYRSPYIGMLYAKNSISKPEDDVCSVSTGEKEVHYLEVVETKTHIAFFVTNKYVHDTTKYPNFKVGNGTNSTRVDGLSALPLGSKGDIHSNSQKSVWGFFNDIEYLQKIVLFSKARPDKPIKVVKFNYDYTLVPGVPNSSKKKGKLTLKKMWFEYDGSAPVRISPYVFSYEYKKSGSLNEGKEYFTSYDKLTPASQNPSYAPWLLDPWGNVTQFAANRSTYDIPWIYQGDNPNFNPSGDTYSWRRSFPKDQAFDPAAWHLKGIRLPSGGEILIQYEQKTYNSVQDRPVMAMASLVSNQNVTQTLTVLSSVLKWSEQHVVINVDDLGCNPKDVNQVNQLIEKIKTHFKGKDEGGGKFTFDRKIYFKFLFDLLGKKPNINNITSDYIDGYSTLKSVSLAPLSNGAYGVKLVLGGTGAEKGDKTFTPRDGARDFFFNQRNGLIGASSKINKLKSSNDKNISDLLQKFKVSTALTVAKKSVELIGLLYSRDLNNENVANTISNSGSFLKLPMYRAKRGGGVRVKRLLMYDSGIEIGAAQMLGQNYYYVLEDGKTSSGVATNEPGGAREENPLVDYMVKRGQGWWSRNTVGEDKDQTEGPIGESILPAASVNYSRVVVENVNSNKVKNGFTVHEFYTTKDFPYDMDYSCPVKKSDDNQRIESDVIGKGVEKTSLVDNTERDNLPEINLLLFSFRQSKLWMTQGFRFIRNSMNGLVKQVSVYGGEYSPQPTFGQTDTNMGYLVSMSQREYYKPGEKVQMLKPLPDGSYSSYYDVPGKETEVAVEKKKLKTASFDFNIEFDLTVGWAGLPIPFVGFFPSISMGRELLAVHSTTKVISYPTILKSTTDFNDGVYSKTEYLAFNPSTGEPLITKTYDGFYSKDKINSNHVGEIYQFSVPAEWKNPRMGRKSKVKPSDQEKYTNQLTDKWVSLVTYGKAPNPEWFRGGAIQNVLSASITTYDNNWTSSWNNAKIKSDFQIPDNINEKLNGIYRPKASYIYKADKNNGEYVSSPNKKIYESGYYDIVGGIPSTFNQDWIKTSEITKYSPNGNPIEEIDVSKIPSTVLYGESYGYNLPVMISSNANYEDIYFNDYEKLDELTTSNLSHSGNYSGILTSGSSILKKVIVTENLKRKGALVKMWISYEDKDNSMLLKVSGSDVSLKRIAISDGWALYEAIIKPSIIPALGTEISASIEGIASGEQAYIDDVRFQPKDSQAACYVYDLCTFKLLTQFDDQHFGLYYVYNDEGALTQKIIETEQGKKVLQETQYNIPKVDKK